MLHRTLLIAPLALVGLNACAEAAPEPSPCTGLVGVDPACVDESMGLAGSSPLAGAGGMDTAGAPAAGAPAAGAPAAGAPAAGAPAAGAPAAGAPAAGQVQVEPMAGMAVSAGPSYAATVEPYFTASCVESCHMEGGLGGPGALSADSSLSLESGMGFAQLTTLMSQQVPTMALVGATVEESYLWHKLVGTHITAAGGKGLPMPYGATAPTDQQAIVRAWIEGGAQP